MEIRLVASYMRQARSTSILRWRRTSRYMNNWSWGSNLTHSICSTRLLLVFPMQISVHLRPGGSRLPSMTIEYCNLHWSWIG